MTIEYEKKEKRGRRGLRNWKRFRFFERDFGGHVFKEVTLLVSVISDDCFEIGV